MADTGAIRAGKASVEITADGAGLAKGIANAQKVLAGFGSAMKAVAVRAFALGTAAAGALVVAGRALAGNGEALAERAGLLGQDGTALFAQANILGRAFDRLSIATGRLVGPLASTLLPFIETLTSVIGSVAESTSKWITENQGLATVAIAATAAIAGIGAGLMIAGTVLTGIGPVIAAVSAGVGALAGVFGLLLTPVGLGVAAVAGLGAAFLFGTDTGRSALSRLKTDTVAAVQSVKETLGSIGDAIAGNNWELAFKIATTGMKLAWLDFKSYVLDSLPGMRAAIAGLGDALAASQRGIQAPFIRFTNFVMPLFGYASGTNRAVDQLIADINREDRGADLMARRNRGNERGDLQSELNALRAQAAQERDAANARREQDAGGLTFGARGTFNSAIGFGLAAPGGAAPGEGVPQRTLSETVRQRIAMERAVELLQQIVGKDGLAFQ